MVVSCMLKTKNRSISPCTKLISWQIFPLMSMWYPFLTLLISLNLESALSNIKMSTTSDSFLMRFANNTFFHRFTLRSSLSLLDGEVCFLDAADRKVLFSECQFLSFYWGIKTINVEDQYLAVFIYSHYFVVDVLLFLLLMNYSVTIYSSCPFWCSQPCLETKIFLLLPFVQLKWWIEIAYFHHFFSAFD